MNPKRELYLERPRRTLHWDGIGDLPIKEYLNRLLRSPINEDTRWARLEIIRSPLSLRDVIERDERRRRRARDRATGADLARRRRDRGTE